MAWKRRSGREELPKGFHFLGTPSDWTQGLLTDAVGLVKLYLTNYGCKRDWSQKNEELDEDIRALLETYPSVLEYCEDRDPSLFAEMTDSIVFLTDNKELLVDMVDKPD
eukprot:TRINITY_DN9362_c0_g1_i1.p2 TRINITY_DN9362_c0_g1~~TRINITY_DN9362_c0_g1_i1.p2  ORF type:complete len:109 (-),score=12.24 TRINITY_DN9362_c0_g1_i1:168-494(-)